MIEAFDIVKIITIVLSIMTQPTISVNLTRFKKLALANKSLWSTIYTGQVIGSLEICHFISLRLLMADILNISRDVLKRKQWEYFTSKFSLQRPGLPPYSGSGWLLPFQESLSPHGRHSEQHWNCWTGEEGNKMHDRKLLFMSFYLFAMFAFFDFDNLCRPLT